EAFLHLKDFDSLEEEVCVFFEPPSIDSRIAAQFGILSAMNGPGLSHDSYFRKKVMVHPNLVHRVVIAAAAKSEIRDMLDQNNINERMLFPGMPGLCDWLKRYYGPAFSHL
ncbi:MAG: FRG domain-containing protein, partial [Bdellovibrionaceae bacterium]|nr:FRG domain-containing protein [Pseudobdellovibrionaceae bacterium]